MNLPGTSERQLGVAARQALPGPRGAGAPARADRNLRQERAVKRKPWANAPRAAPRRPGVVQGRHHLRAARALVHGLERRRHRRLRRPHRQARLPAGPGHQRALAAAHLPLPGSDDGYDISDYTDVHPDVGTLDDFRRFLDEAHRRGLRVITELVLNHTSDQHPWFQRARRAPPGSPERDFYVWSDTPDRYRDARIIFKDFEPSNWSWDPSPRSTTGTASSPTSRTSTSTIRRCTRRCWGWSTSGSALGVDGLRLDAVPYLFERDGTNCENLPETHAFLKKLRAHVDAALQEPHAARRSQPVARGRRRLLRRGRRVPHELPLPDHAAHLHVDAHGGPAARSSTSSRRRRRSPRTASGRSSCATTTS